MGKYLDMIRQDTAEDRYEITKKARNKEDTDISPALDTENNPSFAPSKHVTKETNLTKKGSESTEHMRELPPEELARLDLRFRIVAPDDADAWSIADWIEWVGERSAILEFDGEHSREQADQEALLIWRLYRHNEAQ